MILSLHQLKAVVAAILLVAVVPGAAPAAAPPQLACRPSPEQLSAFGKEAAEFLRQHPEAPTAASVAFDLLLVATAAKDAALTDKMKTTLVMEYPRSVQARYVVSAFDSAKDFNSLLTEQVKKQGNPFTPGFASRYCAALHLWDEHGLAGKLGRGKLGQARQEKTQRDDGFLVQTVLLANLTGDRELESDCLQKLAQSESDELEAARIALGGEGNPAKLALLYALTDNDAARVCERFIFAQLSPEEREQPEVARIVIERQLLQGKLAEALPVMEKLLARERDPRVLFWYGWCQSTLGKGEQALTELVEQYPQSPWAKHGADWLTLIRQRQGNTDATASALAKAISALYDRRPDMLQTIIGIRNKEKELGRIFLAVNALDGIFELQISRSGKPWLCYRNTLHGCLVYVQGENAIHAYAQSGPYLTPQLDVKRNPDALGEFTVSHNGSVNSSSLPLLYQEKIIGLDLGNWRSKEGAAAALTELVRAGWLPAAPQTGPAGCTYRLAHPDVTDPKLADIEFYLGPDDQVRAINLKWLVCEDLRYGPIGSFQLTPLAWPSLPVEQHEKLEPSTLIRMWTAFMGALIDSPDPAAGTTNSPKR